MSIYINPYRFGGAVDPLASSVILLVSGIGANGATAFPDLSPLNVGNGTRTGSPTISTTAPITGFSSSIVLAGTAGGATDYVIWGNSTIPPSLNTPSDSAAMWTIEMVWKPTAAGSVLGCGDAWGGVGTFGGFIQNISDGSFRCYNGYAAGVNGWDFSSAASKWAVNGEYFLVYECNGAKVRLYLGTLAGGTCPMIASTTTFAGGKNAITGGHYGIGYYGFAGQSAGKFNWFRITRATRYNTDTSFAIPTFPLI
jgi:hypothetical protein